MASQPGAVARLLGRIAYELVELKPMLPTYLHLIVSAVFPIYTASHASLGRPRSAGPPDASDSEDESYGKIDDEVIDKLEGLRPRDAILLPILAGCTLCGIYFLLKYMKDAVFLNYVLSIYFSTVGIFFTTTFIRDVLLQARSFIFPGQYSAHGVVWKVSQDHNVYRAYKSPDTPSVICETSPLPGMLRKLPLPAITKSLLWKIRRVSYFKVTVKLQIHRLVDSKLNLGAIDILSALTAFMVVGYDFFIHKYWFVTNLIGFSFSYGALQAVTPTTAPIGSMLLTALFFYDIYFVFYTPIMVTVATQLEVPIKLLFPRPHGCVLPNSGDAGPEAWELYKQCLAKDRAMAMLGLGDIVVPGLLIAFALRFDLYLHYLRGKPKTGTPGTDKSSQPKYLQVTGAWGERFWTKHALRDNKLQAKSFPKPYFFCCVAGYIGGLIATLVSMVLMNHAQPALLYLVPGILIPFWALAAVKGDFKLLLNYSEEEGASNMEKKVEPERVKSSEPTTADQEQNSSIEVNRTLQTVEPSSTLDNKKETLSTTKTTSLVSPRFLSLTFSKVEKRQTVPDSKHISKVFSTDSSETDSNGVSREASEDENKITTSSIAPIPDVQAEQAVFAKLEREATASSADVIGVNGAPPPEKRRRKA